MIWLVIAAEHHRTSMDDDDVVHIPIPRELLLRLVSRHPNITSIEPFSTDADWAYVGRAIAEVASELISPPDRPYYRSQSPSFSIGSSPTLRPSSSRASSAPVDCGFDDDLNHHAYDDRDVPDINMNLDDLFLDEAASGASPQPAATEADIPTTGTKRGSEHPDAPALHDEVAKRAERILRLRGGVWLPECQRKGNRVPLPRDQVEIESFHGLPMVEGPYGPEPDARIEESAGGDNGMILAATGEVPDEGESEVEDDEEEEDEGNRAVQKKAKKGKAYVVDKRPKPTRKEATSMIASLMAISTRRHHNDLCDFIAQLHGSLPSQLESATDSSNPHVIFTLTRRLEAIEIQSKVLDFHRMVLLMQIALWVDW
jgi:hypothetical protein